MKFLHNLFIPAKQFLTLVAILVIGIGFLAYQENTKTTRGNLEAANTCQTAGTTIEVTIKNNQFMPKKISARQCDLLVIINADTQKRSPAFGEHNNHDHYQGFEQRVLGKNQQQTIDLTTTGTYTLHDDFHGVATATIVIE